MSPLGPWSSLGLFPLSVLAGESGTRAWESASTVPKIIEFQSVNQSLGFMEPPSDY